MIRLRVVPADGDPFERVVVAESLRIGRSSKTDLVVPDPLLSREHARLFFEEGLWFVEDLGSHNGTFLNGERVEGRRAVRAGDVLALGGSSVTVRPPEAPAEGARPEGAVFRNASEVLRSGSSGLDALGSGDAAVLRRTVERLHILNEVHHALGHSVSQTELLELILERAFAHLRPEEGAIFLRQKGGEYCCVACRSVHSGGPPFQCSRHLISEVADKGMAALTLDAQTDERFAGADSILGAGVKSLVAAPLHHDGDALGMIVLCSKLSVRQFTEDDLELLVSLASVAALRIRNVALAEEAAERRRLEDEVALARRIQVALLPDSLPEVPGYQLHAGNVPSRWVSGDFYQLLMRGAGAELVVMVADVSGKGVGASLVTASLEALCAGPIEVGREPAEVFDRASLLLSRRVPAGKYATAFLGALEPASGRFRYANAGHPQGLLLRAGGGPVWLSATGVPLALMPERPYGQQEIVLDPGDLVALYSDGITEAEDPEGEEYGRERLAALLRRHSWDDLAALAHHLENDLETFARGVPFGDDRTLVLMRRQPGGGPT